MIEEKKRILTWISFPCEEKIKPSLTTVYLQCDYRKRLITHIRQSFVTYLINLKLSPQALLDGYSKKLRQNIKRAKKAGIIIERDQNPAAVILLFSPTAQEKKLNSISEANFRSKVNFLITRAIHPKHGVLAAHAYQLDLPTQKVQGLYNASAFRQFPDDRDLQYLCGQANSLLYHEDFLYFRKLSYKTYDFGGYGGNASGVDYFKDRFGGTVTTQYNYYPIWYFLVRKIRQAWKK
jgi:lipid II:glycine glycyltransferase (peptidoglycan interpeptide bridge formation enzyme)